MSTIARKMGNTPYIINFLKYKGVSLSVNRQSILKSS